VEIVEGTEAGAEPEVVAGLKEVTNTPEAVPTTDNVETNTQRLLENL